MCRVMLFEKNFNNSKKEMISKNTFLISYDTNINFELQ